MGKQQNPFLGADQFRYMYQLKVVYYFIVTKRADKTVSAILEWHLETKQQIHRKRCDRDGRLGEDVQCGAGIPQLWRFVVRCYIVWIQERYYELNAARRSRELHHDIGPTCLAHVACNTLDRCTHCMYLGYVFQYRTAILHIEKSMVGDSSTYFLPALHDYHTQ